MIYTFTFIDILNKFPKENRISKKILESNLLNLDIIPNYIDISLDSESMIKFIPNNKIGSIKYTLRSNNISVIGGNGGYMNLIKELGFFKPEYIYGDTDICYPSDDVELIEFKEHSIYPNIYFYLIDFHGLKYLVYANKNIMALIPNKTNQKFQDMKIGRFVSTLLNKIEFDYTNKELEEFINMYISSIKFLKNSFDSFKLIKGDEIIKWYNIANYKNGKGTLGGSCMKYNECQDFFDIYTKNEDKCKLLILTDNDKLLGRALIWNLDDGNVYMDRVYTINDNLLNLFERYANSNNMLFFNGYTRNSDGTRSPNIHNSLNEKLDIILEITLDNYNFLKYPYLDTFRYMYGNKISSFCDYNKNFIDMCRTDGNVNKHSPKKNLSFDLDIW